MSIDPEKEQERLDALQKDIDRERHELADQQGEAEPHFTDSAPDEPVDDSIAPG